MIMTLEVKHVTSGYVKEVPILMDVNVVAREGRLTGIIGPNGAGKSTLLKTIYGYLHPSQGDVFHDGHSIKGLKPDQMLGQGIAPPPEFSRPEVAQILMDYYQALDADK